MAKLSIMDFPINLKSVVFSFFASVIIVAVNFVSANSSTLQLNFEDDAVSANIQDVSLKKVIDKIEEETGIWFRMMIKKDAPVLSEEISITFEEEPVNEGLGRILKPVNHALVFDKQDNVIGVWLLGEPERRVYRPRRPVRRRVPPGVRRR